MAEGISKNTIIEVAGAIVAAIIGAGVFHSCTSDKSSDAAPPQSSASAPLYTETPATPGPTTDPPSPSDSPSPTDFSTDSEETAPPTTGGGDDPPASGGDDTGGVAPQPDVRYLSDLDPIGGLGNGESTGSMEMRQQPYGNSVEFSPSYFGAQRLSLTYNIPLHMRYFDATVGLDDRTGVESSVFFQVERNESPVDSGFTLGVDGTKNLHLPISGFQRITITIEVMKRGPDAVNAKLHAVWGNARFATH
ncbi:NPCBM/NEW2 domain-containing protein [Streptomyces sp. NBC_01190]|uniref:NPCBM/NEW2 domain-containing protein n=1 Tax=Streptomyces sp. NBC_01190 TaxID=2903767 RepID=UPI0038657F53|nr:NPCBM/NEW2 domain-containing protein [Streptomyces sp. NBC_01190]